MAEKPPYTDEQIEALALYVEARKRQWHYARHVLLVLAMMVAAWFVVRSVTHNMPQPTLIPPWTFTAVSVLAGIVALLGLGIFAWAVARTRAILHATGLPAELITGLDRYPSRKF
ncbi:hypothetical protein R69658_05952 [Paraburkholderia aspalathi]|uniref:Holin-X, holin superfamily III n=1 Tax=Paraburkholderia aspalathi TaxID=1324617 RepID=A0ABM8SPH7_9BURK|nr:hypothetical protein [Paraburkholderia aspalathi]MBK3822224.1 hypothetical protein [Paraburkholderia aspalathi]MBK3834064.1 hypothetical protein [Paraburkholderia aspalathi]MBK3863812.1 hypothetical protein [Paraburkholderia aspalathi]CAE6823361.1 hypothetical protein R69658_05952 [Paraburkholderia aspalathi]